MIMDAAHANLDVRKRTRPVIKTRVHEVNHGDEPNPMKLPSLYDENVVLTSALSESLRDAMHHARVMNAGRNKSLMGMESVLMPPECYDLEDIDAETLQLMKLEMQQAQGPHKFASPAKVQATHRQQSVRSPHGKSARSAHAAEQPDAAGEDAGGKQTAIVKRVGPASKSATCHWCRQANKWCGWCKRPDILVRDRHDAHSSEGFYNDERSPLKDDPGVLGFLGIGGKKVKGITRTFVRTSTTGENPKTALSRGQKAQHRSVSSLGRLEGGADSLVQVRQNRRHRLKEEQENALKAKKRMMQESEEERKKMLQLLKEKKPISLSLFDDKDLEQLSHRVSVRHVLAGEIVMKYREDCSPTVVALPDTEDGQPVMAMSSPFYIVMNGILDVCTEYSEKGEPLQQGKLSRGCVAGELSAILGTTRGCTVRASMPAGLIQIHRSDVLLLLTQRLATLAAAAELEKTRDVREEADRRHFADLEVARGSIKAALEQKRAIAELILMQRVEAEVFGTSLNAMAREREWKTGGHARAMKKNLESKVKEMVVRKIQRGARRFLALRRYERNKARLEYRRQCVQNIQKTFRGHLARAAVAHTRHMRQVQILRILRPVCSVLKMTVALTFENLPQLAPYDFFMSRERRLGEKAAFVRKTEVLSQSLVLLKADQHCRVPYDEIHESCLV
jgi:CRP-like cAMP-binding protein